MSDLTWWELIGPELTLLALLSIGIWWHDRSQPEARRRREDRRRIERLER